MAFILNETNFSQKLTLFAGTQPTFVTMWCFNKDHVLNQLNHGYPFFDEKGSLRNSFELIDMYSFESPRTFLDVLYVACPMLHSLLVSKKFS